MTLATMHRVWPLQQQQQQFGNTIHAAATGGLAHTTSPAMPAAAHNNPNHQPQGGGGAFLAAAGPSSPTGAATGWRRDVNARDTTGGGGGKPQQQQQHWRTASTLRYNNNKRRSRATMLQAATRDTLLPTSNNNTAAAQPHPGPPSSHLGLPPRPLEMDDPEHRQHVVSIKRRKLDDNTITDTNSTITEERTPHALPTTTTAYELNPYCGAAGSNHTNERSSNSMINDIRQQPPSLSSSHAHRQQQQQQHNQQRHFQQSHLGSFRNADGTIIVPPHTPLHLQGKKGCGSAPQACSSNSAAEQTKQQQQIRTSLCRTTRSSRHNKRRRPRSLGEAADVDHEGYFQGAAAVSGAKRRMLVPYHHLLLPSHNNGLPISGTVGNGADLLDRRRRTDSSEENMLLPAQMVPRLLSAPEKDLPLVVYRPPPTSIPNHHACLTHLQQHDHNGTTTQHAEPRSTVAHSMETLLPHFYNQGYPPPPYHYGSAGLAPAVAEDATMMGDGECGSGDDSFPSVGGLSPRVTMLDSDGEEIEEII